MVEYALSETRNGDKQMKRLAKKLCVCFLAAILGIMPGIVTDAKAASYQWYYNGNYNSIEEARNYSIVNDDHAAAAVGGYINLDSEDSYVGKEHPDAEYEWSTSNQNVKMDVSTDKKSAKITGKVKGSTKVTLTITYKEEIIDNNENTGSNEKNDNNDGSANSKDDGNDTSDNSKDDGNDTSDNNKDDGNDDKDNQEKFEEKTVVYSINVQMTTPKLKSSKIGIVINSKGTKVEVTGNASSERDRMFYATDSRKNFSVNNGNLYATKTQTRNVYVYVDGIILKASVKCTNPKIVRNIAVLKKGQSASYALKGASGYTPVSYSVKNSKYASVSKTGKIKGKRYGKTTFIVKADNHTWQMEIYVVKTSIYKTITKAYAYEKAKTKYSQPKRMKKGYADCSSYVWKCYKTAGIYFGDKSYAPTAANIAKWCTNNKRALKLSTYNGKSTKLKPGDLIFYKKRVGKNGRYKNIEHVSMYIGNDTILHASGKMVSFGYPWYRKVAAIGRPVK